MKEFFKNLTCTEMTIIIFLIVVGLLSIGVGSYAVYKSQIVACNPATSTVSTLDIERLEKAVTNKFDSIDDTIIHEDSLQNELLKEMKETLNNSNNEIVKINKRLNRILNSQ